MKKLISPLPWVGSKRQLRDSIIAKIPSHKCYVEPFAGGAWVYLGKEPSEVEVLNDLNGNLITLYRVLKEKPEEFADALWYLFPSREFYLETKTLFENQDRSSKLPDIDRAALFYYHIKNAFGARFGSGFSFSKTRPPKQAISQELLIALRERLQKTYIENSSYDRVIKNFDSADTFFYLDPPYRVADNGGYYQFAFDEKQHHQLRDTLKKVQGKWMLSYDNCDFIRSLYKGFHITETDPVTYTLSGKPVKKTELLIANYGFPHSK